jgi:endonuclease III-like uncharacterized protein
MNKDMSKSNGECQSCKEKGIRLKIKVELLKIKEGKIEDIVNNISGGNNMNNLETAIALKRLLKEKGVKSVDIDELLKYINSHPEVIETAKALEDFHKVLLSNLIKQKEKELDELKKLIKEGK